MTAGHCFIRSGSTVSAEDRLAEVPGRRLRAWLVSIGLGLVVPLAVQSCSLSAEERPRFADYPSAESLESTPVEIDAGSETWRLLTASQRSQIRQEAQEGPNFAGTHRLVELGCGTACQIIAVVSLDRGTILFGPEPTTSGTDFRSNSRLVIVNADPAVPSPENYWLLEKDALRVLGPATP